MESPLSYQRCSADREDVRRGATQSLLLLPSHVGHQVAHTVAVAKLIVVPVWGGRGGQKYGSTRWKQIFEGHKLEQTVPCDQLDEVVVEGDTGAGVKDGGVAVAVEVCGHDLRGGGKGQM